MNIPLGQWSGSDATESLRKDLKKHQEENAEQTTKIVRLTWVITLLTAVMVIGLAVQIWLALK